MVALVGLEVCATVSNARYEVTASGAEMILKSSSRISLPMVTA
jgi:hypothetical protein